MNNIIEKLKSRKLWTMISTILFIVLNEKLNLGVDDTTIGTCTAIIAAYLVGQGLADFGTSSVTEEKKTIKIPLD